MTTRSGDNIPRWFNPPVLLAGAATALCLFGDQALYVILPANPGLWSVTPAEVGLLLSVNRWVRLATNHLAETLTHRLHPTMLLVGALVLGALLGMSFGVLKVFWMFLAARALWGLCWSFIRQVSVMTVMDASAAADKGKAAGLFNGLTWLGAAVAMAASGFLFRAVGLEWAFLILGGASLLAIVPGVLSRRQLHGRHSEFRNPPADSPPAHTASVLACALLLNVATGAIVATAGYVLVRRAGETMALGPLVLATVEATGVLLMLRYAIDVLGGPFLGALTDRIGHRAGAPLFFALAGGALAAAAFAPGALLPAVLMLLFFVCVTAQGVLLTAHAGRAGSRVFAHYATAVDLGAAVGPLAVWALLGRFPSSRLPLLFSAFACAVAAILASAWAMQTPAPRPDTKG